MATCLSLIKLKLKLKLKKWYMEDMWKQVFSFGTPLDQLDVVHQYEWDFSNLEHAFDEGGVLYGRKVYLFGHTEPLMTGSQGREGSELVPVVIAVVAPFPPSDKVSFLSLQVDLQLNEEVMPMEEMELSWVPYIPPEQRKSQIERPRGSDIFLLTCTRRRADLKHLDSKRLRKLERCLPYVYPPLLRGEIEQDTKVKIVFETKPYPVSREFNWELDDVEEFTDRLIEEGGLVPKHLKGRFMDFVKKQVQKTKEAKLKEREARIKAMEDISAETRAAYRSMRLYKFYPVPTPDNPDVSKFTNACRRPASTNTMEELTRFFD